MTTTCDTDPNTQTIAAAWASSPLGQPEGEVPSGFATAGPTEPVTARADERSAKRVMVATGLTAEGPNEAYDGNWLDDFIAGGGGQHYSVNPDL